MNQEKIGKFISKLRKEKDMTQQDLADRLSTTDKSVSRWENGKCMPDLSLFPLLSKELDVSVNDLMSGEKIDKKDYQEVFEGNVVKTIAKVENSNKNYNLIRNIFLGIILFICLWFITYVFINTYRFILKYDKLQIEVNEISNGIQVVQKNSCSTEHDYVITKKSDEQGFIFVNTKCDIYSYFNHKSQIKSSTDLTTPNTSTYDINLTYTNIPNKYKVYYTETSLNKVRQANAKELDEILKKSYLIYDSEQ